MNFLYRILVLSFSVSIFSEGIILPIYAVFVQDIGGDILDAGWAWGVFLITQGVFTIFVHKFPRDYHRRLTLMVWGWFIWVLGVGLYFWVSSIWMLLVAQVFTAIGNAIADPIFDQELAAHTDKGKEEFEWGFFEGGSDVVAGIAAIIGGAIAAFYGFQALIVLMIVTATISFLLILVYTRTLRQRRLTIS